jgi:IMP dehydrogenase/GMP reductase
MAHPAASPILEALAFDDVLVVPGFSEVLPTATDTTARLTPSIGLNIPLISAAMDTVTEAAMSIAMAQAGGLGVIHKNLTPEQQAAEVRRVKKYESGMVVNPLTIDPDQTLADARALMTRRYSHQPRRALRHRPFRAGPHADDAREPDHRPPRRWPRRGPPPVAPPSDREAAGGGR